MQIVVGLGNPGARYALNRHNVGFMALDAVADAYGFAPWRTRFQAQVSEGQIAGMRLLLVKPQTWMNESGRAVGEVLRFYKASLDVLTVMHDELDLAPGRVKLKQGGGAAGHNGLRSIIAHAGDDFQRVRIGIGRPAHKDQVTPYVLSNFAQDELDGWLPDILGALAREMPWLLAGDGTRFLSEVAHALPKKTG